MFKWILLLYFCTSLTQSVSQYWDFVEGRTMNCKIISTYSKQQFWDAIRLHDLVRYFVFATAPIEIILLFLVLISYTIKQSKSRPSDILMGLAASQILIVISALIISSYEQLYQTTTSPPSNFLQFCNYTTAIQIFGWIAVDVYSIGFCVVLSYTVRNTLKKSILSKLGYHTVSIIAIVAISFGIFYSNYSFTGTMYSLCVIKYSIYAPYVKCFISICLILVAFISIYRFKTGIPKNSFFQSQSIYKYYYYYIAIMAILQVTAEVSNLVGTINCHNSHPDPGLAISFSISNIIYLINPFLLIMLRFKHPKVNYQIKRILRKLACCFKCCQCFSKNDDDRIDIVQMLDQNQDSERQILKKQQYNWLGSLLQSIRGSQIYSFLTAILISHMDFKNDMNKSIKSADYYCRYVFTINQQTADFYMNNKYLLRQTQLVNFNLGGIKPLDFQITAYCPRVFRYFVQESGINLQESLSFRFNSTTITDVANISGGKSGQFFFFSYDYKILFKTITKQQAHFYLDNIHKFVEHFEKTQQNSLLSQIIGLYKFKRLDIIDENIYLILQKNVSMCESKFIERAYDLKGSTYNRQFLNQKRMQAIANSTLLDIDFMKNQKKISVGALNSKNIIKILKNDIEFLKKLQVMDYSFLVMKVNWNKIKQQQQSKKKYLNKSFILPRPVNRYAMVHCETMQGVYYHFAIIDYLQTWSLAKQTQRLLKQMVTSQQITASQPKSYAERLMKFIQSIF